MSRHSVSVDRYVIKLVANCLERNIRNKILDVLKESMVYEYITQNGYKALAKRVAIIDPKAAVYMLTDALELESFIFSPQLRESFTFDETPQGHSYWYNICQQFGEYDE